MPAIGAPVGRRLVAVFTIARRRSPASPGALLAQTTQFVGLDVLGLPALGGRADHARRSAAPAGCTARSSAPALFMLMQDYLARQNPVYWQFWIGLLLVAVVLFARGGMLGGARRRARAAGAAGGRGDRVALRTEGLCKAWGGALRQRSRHAWRCRSARATR